MKRYNAPRAELTRGSPRFVISEQQLRFFVNCGFSRKEMAGMLNVSTQTVKRRLR